MPIPKEGDMLFRIMWSLVTGATAHAVGGFAWLLFTGILMEVFQVPGWICLAFVYIAAVFAIGIIVVQWKYLRYGQLFFAIILVSGITGYLFFHFLSRHAQGIADTQTSADVYIALLSLLFHTAVALIISLITKPPKPHFN